MREFRTIHTIAQARQYHAVKADRLRTDPDEPAQKRPDPLIFDGSWADIHKSNVYRDRKAPRLNKYRAARRQRERERDLQARQ